MTRAGFLPFSEEGAVVPPAVEAGPPLSQAVPGGCVLHG